MNNITKYLIGVAIALIIAFTLFFSGCQYGKTRVKCPVITHDTTYVWDTVEHHIIDHVPYYVTKWDTIIFRDTIPQKIDTLEILHDYYAIHIYDRVWKDSLLQVNLKDFISENKLLNNDFNYKILRPQSVIINTVDNSILYNRYFTIGLGVPIKDVNYINIEATYQWNKAYLGVQYMPKINSFGIRGGAVLFKIKTKK
jgi:hypothetical protein